MVRTPLALHRPPPACARRRWMLAALAVVVQAATAAAGVVDVQIDRRAAVLDGRTFGDAGAYEKLVGTVRFAFDPANPANAAIVDLARAPRNAEGLVEADADLMVLRPLDPERGRGTALVEVSNRGGKASLGYFQRARYASDPTSEAELGDGYLLELGLTVVWIGWQFDVPREEGRLRLRVPNASGEDGDPLTGLVRADWTVDELAPVLDVAHRDHVAYPVADPDDPANVLTVRDGRYGEREVVPRESWRFASLRDDGVRVEDPTHVWIAGGFEAGRIYELVYRAEDPAVVGLGLAAIRDVLAYAKHDESCPFGVERGVAVGISQTGRFLRHFLYQGFNTDEQGRAVYDGLLVHTAGAGRGSFNHRFAQPSRDGHRYSAFAYPTDLFPFTGRTQADPVTRREDGLLAREQHPPKVFYTNTGYEYWGRAASLLHTTPDGGEDVAPLDNVRIYHLASAQHFVSGWPPRAETALPGAFAFRGNPLDFLVTERALLAALLDWVETDVPPPESAYPTRAEGTLVAVAELDFPAIHGVTPPAVVHLAERADYGPDWELGLVTRQPPGLGEPFTSLVPQVDDFGNEQGGVPTIETLVPLATYTPWSVRTGMAGGNGELVDFRGNLAPLPRTAAEKKLLRDGRPTVEQTYGTRAEYLRRVQAAADELVERRLLLERDVPRVLDRARESWTIFVGDVDVVGAREEREGGG